jgi:methyl-accepting chemotaxis protein
MMARAEWTFGQRIGAGFALAALVLAVVAAFGHRSSARLIDNDRLVEHTQSVRQEVAGLLSMLKDAETGQRGYVITGDEAFLEPYTQAERTISGALERLRHLTEDDIDQQRRMEQVQPLIASKLAELKRSIDARRTGGFEAARKIIATGRGKELMDQVRQILGDLDQEEAERLQVRFADSEASVRAAQVVMLWGGVLGVLLIAGLGFFIVRTLSREIIGAVGHIQSSSSELQVAANQQSIGSREQVTSITEISSTVSELLATSRQIAESSQRVAHIAGETAQAAGKGDQTVQRASDSVATTRRHMDLIVGHMLDLGKKSQQIGGVLEIINELSEQTNILSINASVEAAGAGEAGRRFAVVADEIRKLADRVGGSTKEIRTLVEEVRAAVNTTVMATEGGAKAAEAGTKQFSELAVSFQGIVGMVGTSREVAREIELSTRQQATAVEQVTLAISNIAKATRETDVSAGQTLQTAKELTQLARVLSRLVQVEAGS